MLNVSAANRAASRIIILFFKTNNSCLQNQILAHNTSARIIWSNQSLVLQSVTRSSAGKYVCAATNDLNETRSEPLHFRVKCEYTSREPLPALYFNRAQLIEDFPVALVNTFAAAAAGDQRLLCRETDVG